MTLPLNPQLVPSSSAAARRAVPHVVHRSVHRSVDTAGPASRTLRGARGRQTHAVDKGSGRQPGPHRSRGHPVSVTELHVPNDAAGPDRTPPNDVAAEQSVLGAMLLSKDAIADVVEVLREGDFYRPAHQVIYGDDPGPLRPRRARRRRHGGGRPHPHRRHRPRRRRALPAHPRLDGAHRRERRLLRPHRAREGDPAPPGRGRHPHRRRWATPAPATST